MEKQIKIYSNEFSPRELEKLLTDAMGEVEGIELEVQPTEAGTRDLNPEVLKAILELDPKVLAAGIVTIGALVGVIIRSCLKIYEIRSNNRQKRFDREHEKEENQKNRDHEKEENQKDRELKAAETPTIIVQTNTQRLTLNKNATPQEQKTFVEAVSQSEGIKFIGMPDGE